jgi:hypothetical protein
MARKKTEQVPNPVPLPRNKVPLGLHQASLVDLPDIDIALAQADGSVINPPTGQQIITAVGTYHKWGLDIFNCYLGDGRSYIQLVSKGGKLTEARLWCSRDEILPQSSEDWEFWLGSWQRDAQGDFLRDKLGQALRKEWGLIGWPQFRVDGPPAIMYNRAWSPGTDGVAPVAYTETILDAQGNTTTVKHEAMEYHRSLTDAADAVTESLLATMVQDSEGASVNLFIGIPLDHQNLKVLQS